MSDGAVPAAGRASRVADSLSWAVGALIALIAAQSAVQFDTPIDHAVPLAALFVFAWSWCVRETRWWAVVQIATPVIVVVELLPLDESLRLAIIALSTAFAFATVLLANPEIELQIALFLTMTATVLLRWLPSRDLRIFRELLVLGGAWLILVAFRRRGFVGPTAIAVAVGAALVTPAIPLRTVAFPYLIAALVWIARLDRVRLHVVGAAISALLLALFPWSGIVVRAPSYFVKRHRADGPRHGIHAALAPGQSIDVWLPQYAESLIVSGANVSRLRPQTILGWIEPGHVAIRIADAADWGYMRREHFFTARNQLPRDPAGRIRDYGYSAWVDGNGRVALPVRRGTIHVTADSKLPAAARLQVEWLESTRQ